jgi:putrescine transport system permease protein
MMRHSRRLRSEAGKGITGRGTLTCHASRGELSCSAREGGLNVGRAAVLVVPWAWLALFLLAPTAIVVRIAFSEAADAVPPYTPGLSFVSVAQVLSDPLYAHALWLSVKVAGLSTLACVLAGYPMALAIARAAARRRVLLLLLTMLPFWTGFLMRINAGSMRPCLPAE